MSSFHSEWFTIGHHRVYLDCRYSFPDALMKSVAVQVATICDKYTENRARLLKIWLDDKGGSYFIQLASDTHDDLERIGAVLWNSLDCVFEMGGWIIHMGITSRRHTSHAAVRADFFERMKQSEDGIAWYVYGDGGLCWRPDSTPSY